MVEASSAVIIIIRAVTAASSAWHPPLMLLFPKQEQLFFIAITAYVDLSLRKRNSTRVLFWNNSLTNFTNCYLSLSLLLWLFYSFSRYFLWRKLLNGCIYCSCKIKLIYQIFGESFGKFCDTIDKSSIEIYLSNL